MQERLIPAKVGGRPTSLAISLADWKEFHYLCMFFLSSTILLVQLPLRLTLSGLPPRLAGIIHLAKPLCRWQAFILESLPGSEVQNLSRSSFARENYPRYGWWQANELGRQSGRLEGVSLSLRVLSVFHNFASPTSQQANPVWPATKTSRDKLTLQNLSAGGRLSF